MGVFKWFVTNADVGELAVTMFEEGTIDAESYNWLLGISETETVQQTSPGEAKTTYSDNTNGKSEVQEQVETTGKMTFGEYYSNVVRKPYSEKASSRVRNMSATERIFAKAGAKAEDISVAASQAKGMQYDGEKEVEAYEYGLEQRKNGNGQDLDLLIEATDYLDSIGESGIMEEGITDISSEKIQQVHEFYEADIGSMDDETMVKLDDIAWETKQNGFDPTGFNARAQARIEGFNRYGNAASMEFDGKEYFSHSQAGFSDSLAILSYKGKYPIIGLSEDRKFKVLDTLDDIDRKFDTEAKFLEYVASVKKPEDTFTVEILSEKHICDSCLYVVQQFKEMFPNATVNIVSGRRGYNGDIYGNSTWTGREE